MLLNSSKFYVMVSVVESYVAMLGDYVFYYSDVCFNYTAISCMKFLRTKIND